MLKYDLDEIITGAIMGGTPVLIVEGKDDVKFYDNLSPYIDTEYEIYCVENFEEFDTGGCDSVIKAIELLQDKIDEREENTKYILGVIDRDARYYRNELPDNLKCLIVLKYYSFESHLITKNNLIKLINNTTSIGIRSINDDVLDFVESNVKKDFEKLYYISLEALENACKNSDNSIVGYSADPGAVADPNHRVRILDQVMKKKEHLDNFAKSKDIKFHDLKNIAKGKWILYTYCFSILPKVKELSTACSQNQISQCQYCKTGSSKKHCLYSINGNYQVSHLVNQFNNFVDLNEVDYIVKQINLSFSNGSLQQVHFPNSESA